MLGFYNQNGWLASLKRALKISIIHHLQLLIYM